MFRLFVPSNNFNLCCLSHYDCVIVFCILFLFHQVSLSSAMKFSPVFSFTYRLEWSNTICTKQNQTQKTTTAATQNAHTNQHQFPFTKLQTVHCEVKHAFCISIFPLCIDSVAIQRQMHKMSGVNISEKRNFHA